jgi:FkbM family methyltransferase
MKAGSYRYKALARNLLAHAGLRAYRRPDALSRLLERHGIDVVLDVGANAGQFARRIRAMGYRGRIVSFEPLAQAFDKLVANTQTIGNWQAVRLALGDKEGTRDIFVAGNSQSSSFLEMLPRHVQAEPKSAYRGTEQVNVRCLDSIYGDYCGEGDRCLLKVDVQGFEDAVLRGAAKSIGRCIGLQLELSVVPLYEGALTMTEMIDRLAAQGFALADLQTGFVDPQSGELLQVDGTFVRRTSPG